MNIEEPTKPPQGGQSALTDGLDMPRRVVLSRKKGWKMPLNTVKVSRPSKWGNQFTVEEYGRKLAVDNYRRYLIGKSVVGALDLTELKGKNLACWCKIGEACHADVLLAMANVK
jgi:hypothetical protein